MTMLEHLTIVTTGGTIDKIYFDDKSSFQIGAPRIGEILSALGVAFEFDVIALMRKDSLHMTDEDRELVRRTIAAQPHRHVLVTHGTDTMVDTARVLRRTAGQGHRADRRAESGAIPGFRRRIQYRLRGRCRTNLARWRLHRNERPHLGSDARAQESRRESFRGSRRAPAERRSGAGRSEATGIGPRANQDSRTNHAH